MNLEPPSFGVQIQIGNIKYEAADRVVTITFNRPEKLNAIAERMSDNLVESVERATNEDSVRSIILTGAGRRF